MYCNSGILGPVDATNRKEQQKSRATRPASAKNTQLWGATGKMFAGGLTTLTFVGLAGASLPAFYEEAMAADGGEALWEGYHAFDMTERFAMFTLPGLYAYGTGIADATNALNNFDMAVAGRQAQSGYPNVP